MPRGLKSEDHLPGWYCTICDQQAALGQRWFALTQDRREDRLSIFHREDVIGMGCVHYACSPVHVRELVIHWMVTGSLDYPFAKAKSRPKRAAQDSFPLWECNGNDRKPVVAIGELAVDREAVQRALRENPAGLEVILEELHDALQKSIEEPLDTQTLPELLESLLPHI